MRTDLRHALRLFARRLICLVARPRAGAEGMAAAVRAALHSIDPEQPVEKITTLDRIVRENMAEERFYTRTTAASRPSPCCWRSLDLRA